MRRLVTFLSLGLIVEMIIGVGPASAHSGAVACQRKDYATNQCTVSVTVPAQPSTADTTPAEHQQSTGNGSACYFDPSKQGLTGAPAGPVACSTIDGYWSNAYNCYIQTAKPQPPPGDPVWQGHDPTDGAIYNCSQPQSGMLVQLWSATAPAGGGPTPGEVAQDAVKGMGLSAIAVGIVPKPGPDSIGLVGMPVWMWADQPGPTTVGPITRSASAGGITVAATATLESITWDMGDGHSVVCHGPGTPYDPSYGRRESPDCGYVYAKTSGDEPEQSFKVTATSQWVVSWTGAGQTGTIRLAPLKRDVQIRIGEAQVLVD